MGKTLIKYGSLSHYEQDDDGFTFFGAGNTADGWHSQQSWSEPTPMEIFLAKMFRQPVPVSELSETAGAKVHYRTGEDAPPANANGNVYEVDGGYQQDGVHNASGTNLNRASWNVDYSLYDNDGEFGDAFLWVDINPSAAKEWLKFKYNEDADAFVAKDSNGNLRFIGTGDGPETVLQDSINMMFFSDLIDNDGNKSNGVQTWDMEHGQFDYKFGQNSAEVYVTVNVGPMLDAMV